MRLKTSTLSTMPGTNEVIWLALNPGLKMFLQRFQVLPSMVTKSSLPVNGCKKVRNPGSFGTLSMK
jgi:hypothetical protein